MSEGYYHRDLKDTMIIDRISLRRVMDKSFRIDYNCGDITSDTFLRKGNMWKQIENSDYLVMGNKQQSNDLIDAYYDKYGFSNFITESDIRKIEGLADKNDNKVEYKKPKLFSTTEVMNYLLQYYKSCRIQCYFYDKNNNLFDYIDSKENRLSGKYVKVKRNNHTRKVDSFWGMI